jgi:hypothetical protein
MPPYPSSRFLVAGNIILVRYVHRIPPEGPATFGDHVYPAHIVKTTRVDLAAEFIPRTEVSDAN